ncbi:hypothetical protein PBI_SCTP2_396 [Salicola phage SCTP-2]|nr:hypothetical protein PBI_SCTP2_396 [Salicola phage SCTP-2]
MLMTLEDFKYIFENRNIKIVYRDKDHSMRLYKGDYCFPHAIIPYNVYHFCEHSIDVFARFWKNNTVTKWEQIDINPTKDSIEHYLNTTKNIIHLKLEIPQHQFIIRILHYIFEEQYKKNIKMSLFHNKLMEGEKSLKFYNVIILKCHDPDWELRKHLQSYNCFKDKFTSDSRSIDVILWSDENGVFSNDVKDWKKLKLLILQNRETIKQIKLSTPSDMNRNQFVSFINCLMYLKDM